jgi:replication factor C subunit 1
VKWLNEWDAVHLQKRIKIPYDKANPGAKAALLSGPPGIGKSTTARLIAEECGREIFELNASDTRSKRMLSEELKDVVQSGVVSFGDSKKKPKRRVVIMDEVDGMSASDRGGVAELIKIIKTSKTPIICICNDHSKSSVRSLANHCFDLKFQRPQVPSVMKRMKEIAKAENLAVEDKALEGLIQSSGNDIRQVLNALQMWRVQSDQLTDVEARKRIGEINKDAAARLTHFDATRFIFNESKTAPLNKRNESFFIDYDMIPLMISQNYVSAIQASRTHRDDMVKMEKLAQAADAVCDSDVIARYVRNDMRWDLLTTQAMMNIRVASICEVCFQCIFIACCFYPHCCFSKLGLDWISGIS